MLTVLKLLLLFDIGCTVIGCQLKTIKTRVIKWDKSRLLNQ